MKRFLLCIFVLAMAFSATSAFAVIDNLLVNPGFEDGMSPWVAVNEVGTCTVDTSVVHSGLQSFRYATPLLQYMSAKQNGPTGGWALPVGSNVTLSAWIRRPAVASIKFRLRLWFTGGAQDGTVATITNSNWNKVSMTYTTTAAKTVLSYVSVQIGGTNGVTDYYYMDDAVLSVSNVHHITASCGPHGKISPAGSRYVLDSSTTETYTFTPDYGYAVSDVLVDGVSQGPISSYTFPASTVDHTISVSFTMANPSLVSGHVNAAPGGGATVSFKSSPKAVPGLTATTDASGNYSLLVPAGAWYACASQTGYMVSSDQTLNISGPTEGVNFDLQTCNRNIPRMESMILAVNNDALTMQSGEPIATWPTLFPVGGQLTALPAVPPTMMTVQSVNWEKNTVANLDGFRFGSTYWPTGADKQSIPCSGATIVASVRPDRSSGDNDNYKCIVNIFYSRLCLVMQNGSGIVGVRRNTGATSTTTWSTYALPDLTAATLSLVAQPDGSYVLYANGTQILTGAATAEGLTSLVPGVNSNANESYDTFIDIGRNETDAWSVFNGGINDVYIYNAALSASELTTLEQDILSRRAPSFTITASAGANGTITPSGAVTVDYGMSKTFAIAPNNGYAISDVLVDGVSVGAVSSYTFDNVTAAHTISASFYALTPYTITASAGSNGTISPNGALTVYQGKSQTFSITPDFGYNVADILVDGSSVGTGTSYTFDNIGANHTIAVTFAPKPEYAISGKVIDSVSGLGVANAKIYISRTANASVAPYRSTTADENGNYSISLFDAAWYACASHDTHATTADQTITVVNGPLTDQNITMVANGRYIPQKDKLLFSALTSAFPNAQDASTGAWSVDHPFGMTSLALMGTPTVNLDGDIPWAKSAVADGDGYVVMGPMNPPATIPVQGATIVVAVKPVRDASTNNGSIVNIFRQNLVLAVNNNTGKVAVWRNASAIGNFNTSTAVIPDGQKTVLSLVVQPTGAYKVFANGVTIMDVSAATMNGYGAFNAFVPNQSGSETTKKYINIGRANSSGDTNTFFNGDIGDVFVYKTALSDTELAALQDDLGTRFNIPIVHYTTLSGKVTLDDGVTPIEGAKITAIGNNMSTITTGADGKYLINVETDTYLSLSVSKDSYIVSYPYEGQYDVMVERTPMENFDFKLTPINTLTGFVKDANGKPVYNAIVQVGGVGGPAAITNIDGSYKVTNIPIGGVELYADALGYADSAQSIDTTPASWGPMSVDITLTPKNEIGVIKNGGLENWSGALPTDWTTFQNPEMTASASTDAFTGTYSGFVTATNRYAFLMTSVDVIPGSQYNCYFKLKADSTVNQCFPMPAFRDNAGNEILATVSAEPGYSGYVHNPSKSWMQYLLFNVGGTPMPFCRISAPEGATKMTVVFGFENLPPVGKGIYVDDVVIDRVGPDVVPVTTIADLKAQAGTNVPVQFTGNVTIVSKGKGLFFIAEDQFKTCIKVVGTDIVTVGDALTNMTGVVTVDSYNQYTVTLTTPEITGTSATAIKPIAMNNKAAKTDAKARGHFVKVWGSVNGDTISDGYSSPISVKDASLDAGTVAITGVLWQENGDTVIYQNLP